MGLDVYIKVPENEKPYIERGTGIYIRKDGGNYELTLEEAKEMYPNAVIEEREYESCYYYSGGITHNLNRMADFAGLYKALWRPEELFPLKEKIYAEDLIETIGEGLKFLKENKEECEKLNPENGWGTYENLVQFTENYYKNLKMHPKSEIEVCR